MKTENPVRVATLGKIQRDGENIKRFARFVIVLRNGVPELIDNGKLWRHAQPFARLVAVLGPVCLGGTTVPESVLLEIGYSRARPYAPLEQVMVGRATGKGGVSLSETWTLPERIRARRMSDSELQIVYPMIERCMTEIVLECRETWKSKDRWWVPGPGRVEGGIRFTFDKADRSLYRQVLLEDIRFRKDRYIRGHARRIRRLIGHYRHAEYSERQLGRFTGVEKVVDLFREMTYDNLFYRRVLLECFRQGSLVRELLERMSRMFRLHLEGGGEYAAVVYDEEGPSLGLWKNIRARVIDQPRVHAKHGVVFEITLERSYRERNEVPF